LSQTLPVTGNTQHTRPENRAFYPALDGIRALAFLMVFFQHYTAMPWGWAGVDLFFVLSGFLITGILFDSLDDRHRARNFYLRRTLRIFPLYYGILLLLLLSTPYLHWRWTWMWFLWPAYLGNFARFIHRFVAFSPLQQLADFQITGDHGRRHVVLYLGHFWSLCVEEQFYLMWPWVVFWLRDRRRILYVCAVSIPVCLALRLAGQHYLPAWMLDNEVLYRATPFRLDALLLGGLLALWLRGPQSRALLRAARYALPAALAALVLWGFLTPYGNLTRALYIYPPAHFTWGLTIIDTLAALLILVALQPGSLIYRIFKVRPLRWLGRISYGAYVLHDIPHNYYGAIGSHIIPILPGDPHSLRLNLYAVAAVGLAMTLLLAWLSFRFFESPFLDLKERYTLRG
jgi:peptidoglycan/LPS O-acetylase OafA/YrhL